MHSETAAAQEPQRFGPNPDGLRVVVLISGGGSNLAALLAAHDDPSYGARIVAVGADRHSAGGLELARAAGIPTFVERISDHADRAAWDHALTEQIVGHEPGLVVSAGFLKLVGDEFLARFPGRYINTHNALLPSFPGMHGPRDALEYGVRIAGATLFVVDAGIDTGPILAQTSVPVLDSDTEDTLTERIKQAERAQLVEQVSLMARHGWTIQGRRVTTGMTQQTSTPQAGTATQTNETAAETDRSATEGRRRITRALLSVSDKAGLVELATALVASGVSLVSTGGSAALLADAGLPVMKVEDVTGFPECLDGRVKTLHPKIHGGLLADTRKQSHLDQLRDLQIEAFDLVVVNLYPFRATVASGASPDECIEQIDIGGPAMIRASAKNHPSVTTVVEPGDYPAVIDALHAGGFSLKQRQTFAAKAFAHTASYDVAVASWMNAVVAPDEDGWPRWTGSTWERQSVLRYGENPHQKAALYRHWRSGLAGAQQLHGKEMSYNNYVDVDAAWRAAGDFSDPAVAIIKHANPCGIAVVTGGSDEQIAEAHVKALACDPVSAFGGVIAVNRRVTLALAEQVAPVFTEVLLAPGFDDDALEVLTRKKNIRLLVMPAQVDVDPVEFRGISGGVLAQTRDEVDAPGDDPSTWTLAAGPAVDAATLADLDFAWRACRAVKSNAILLASDGASVGIGMGQVNRVDSCRLAIERAGERAAGSVAASDAYFPFSDGPQILFDARIKAVVQPGGSVRDPETIAAAEAAGVTMYFTGTRHFFH